MPAAEEVYAEGRRSIQEARSSQAQRFRSTKSNTINEPARFFMLLVGVYACICASTSYVYNLFSGRLQDKYDFTQKQMAAITTMANVLGIVVFPLAGVYDYYGPRPLFMIGMVTFPIGAILFGLAFADVIDGSVARFTIFSALLGVGTAMFDIAGLMTILSVFPSSRGAVIAVMKTFIGIGSAIFGALQLGFFEDSITGFFYLLAAFVAVVGLLCVLFVELPPYQLTVYEESYLTDAEKAKRLATKRVYLEKVPSPRRFAFGFALVSFLIVFLPVQSTAVVYLKLGHTYKRAFALITIAVMVLYSVIAIPLRWLDIGSSNIADQLPDEDEAQEAAAATASGRRMTAAQRLSMRINTTRTSIAEQAIFNAASIDESAHIAPQYQTTFFQSVCTLKLWALAYSLFCIFGTQMVIITNARFVYAAASETTMTQEVASLLTVFNGAGSAVGRIIMSIFEVWTQKRKPEERIPLTIALFIPTLILLAASVLLLVVQKEWLLLPFGLTALGNGFSAASVVLVMRTLYAKDVANHYNCMSLASLVASVLLNQVLYGSWYTKEAKKQQHNICYGRQCIFVPFVVMSILLFTSLFSTLYVHLRYKSFCDDALAERAQLHGVHARPTRPDEPYVSDEQEPLLAAAH
ncbi:Nodulin-like protein [Novymonas esmeraldas]|uniref:Nodulin-like protein n=1 Tax=Novymonas esmeraldas TaxID=1808958 RepID=A0AAW0EWP5_9TRYP